MMVQIRKAMLEYGKHLRPASVRDGMVADDGEEASLRVHASLLAFGKPSKRQSKNLHNYFMAYNPLVEEENQYIFAVKDLITLSADRSERSSLFTLIESIKPLAKMFTTEVNTLEAEDALENPQRENLLKDPTDRKNQRGI